MLKIAVLLAGLALLAGCSTHPITGRNQIIALPEVQVAHADVGFALSTAAQRIAATMPCDSDCISAEALALFASRVAAMAARLDAPAREMSPELFKRIGRFHIEVNAAIGAGTAASAGGRIALGAGLVRLEPSDAVIAFLIGREMAHVIARHPQENSGASIVFSALGMLVPGVSVIVRFIATTLGSGALKDSWAAQQQREADEIAVTLLQGIGLPATRVALELETGVQRSRLPDDDWGLRYLESAQRVVQIAASPPRYAEAAY